jgi:2-aminoadipate transaminase
VVAARELIPSLLAIKRLGTLGNAWLTEAIVSRFLESGDWDRHLSALQPELSRRYESCLALLAELMPEGVRWTKPAGGPTLWLDVPRRVDLRAVQSALAERGVQIENSEAAFAGEAHLNGFRVGYAYQSTAKLRGALELVAEELKRALARG